MSIVSRKSCVAYKPSFVYDLMEKKKRPYIYTHTRARNGAHYILIGAATPCNVSVVLSPGAAAGLRGDRGGPP